MELRRAYCEVITLFPYKMGFYGLEEEDFFDTLVLLCMEADPNKTASREFQGRACQMIQTNLAERRRETRVLYNPYQNLYLDKCYGDSQNPLETYLLMNDK